MRYKKSFFTMICLIVLVWSCGKKNPTGSGEELSLGTVKCKTTGSYSKSFEYTNCQLAMEKDTALYGLVDGFNSESELKFLPDGASDPDKFSSFPVSLNVTDGEVMVVFSAFGKDTFICFGDNGSFTINGRRDDHSIYGTFNINFTNSPLNNISGSFNLPRAYQEH